MGRSATWQAMVMKPLIFALTVMMIIGMASIGLVSASRADSPATTGQSAGIEGGEMTWGISTGWRSYLNRPFVGGHTQPVAPAQAAADHRVTFVQASGNVDTAAGSGSIEYRGGIQSQGHKGQYVPANEWGLNQTLTDPVITLTSTTSATLSVVVDQSPVLIFPELTSTRVTIANLVFTAHELVSGTVSAKATFTQEGAKIYGEMNENYVAGAPLDNLQFSFTTEEPEPAESLQPTPAPSETSEPIPTESPDASQDATEEPAPSPTPTTPTASASPTATAPPVSGVEGSLQWGVKESFRNYVLGRIANGKITPSSGAQQAVGNGIFTFPQASEGTTWNGTRGTIQYAGNVNFYGHDGVMDVTLSNPKIVVESDSKATVQTQFNGQTITVATIGLSQATKRSLKGDAVQFVNAPVSLHAQGVNFFSYNGNGFYAAGELLDPVTFTIGDNSDEELAVTPTSNTTGNKPMPSDDEPAVNDTPAPAATGVTTGAAGALTWPISHYFAKYTTERSGSAGCPTPSKHCAAGAIETSGVGSGYVFPQATGGSWNETSHTGTVNFSGIVRFKGYGMTMFQVANPTITVHNASSATIKTGNTTSHGQASYQLDLSRGSKKVNDNGTVTWSNVPVRGSLAGISASQSIGLDPVSFTVGSASATTYGTSSAGTDAASTESTYEPATSAPSTEGLEILTPADRIREGGRIKARATGFESGDAGVLAVLYDAAGTAEPIILDDTATADDDGVIEWSGTLPAGATGQHTLTLQGSTSVGAPIDILPAQATVAAAPHDATLTPETMAIEELRQHVVLAQADMQNWEWWASAGALLSIAGCSVALVVRHRRLQPLALADA